MHRAHRRPATRGRSPATAGCAGLALRPTAPTRHRPGGVLRRHPAARRAGPRRRPRGRRARRHRGRRAVPHRPTRHVFAIGECAALGGRIYGLVAPGYAMAEVVADRLLGGAGHVHRRRHVHQAQAARRRRRRFGDAHATTEGALERGRSPTRSPASTRSWSSSDDGDDRLLGGILVGDASAYGMLRAAGRPAASLPADPEALLLAAARAGRRPVGVARCPTRRRSAPATTSPRARSRAADRRTGCDRRRRRQGVHPGRHQLRLAASRLLNDELLASQRRRPSTGRCASTSTLHPAGAVRPGRGARHHRRSRRLIVEAHGRGRGCDICKPAVASILASASATATSSTASRPRCRTPTTTSSPTSSATAPTRWCPASPAARSPRTSSS